MNHNRPATAVNLSLPAPTGRTIVPLPEDRLPPHNLEAEASVIGSILLDNGLIPAVRALLRPADFYRDSHEVLYRAAMDLAARGKPVDGLMLADELARRGELERAGGHDAIAAALATPPHAANGEYYAHVVREKALMRRAVEAAQAIERAAYSGLDTADEVVAAACRFYGALAPPPPEPTLQPIGVRDLFDDPEPLNEPIVDGLLRRGEILNLVGPSKTGKSWLSMGLALSVASGRAWLDRFRVRRSRVLLLDNELHRSTLKSRLKWVAQSMGLGVEDIDGYFSMQALRGNLLTLPELEGYFRSLVGQFDMVILDSGYRFTMPGESENDNAALTIRYNLLDRYAALLNAAIVYVHHSSKGSQLGKETTDIGAGAGAQSRATDTHLVLVADAALGPGALAVDAAIRSFPPLDPFVIRRDGPLWKADDTAVPAKGEAKRKPIGAEEFALKYAGSEPRSRTEIEHRAMEDGMPQRATKATFDAAIRGKFLHPWKIAGTGQRHPMYSTCEQQCNTI